ncbi:Nuclear transcription factor Y subunit C-2 [Dichanthelium oligosanthes]|uniref:Nuclear transcription factor Y subunit C-2 n=1 Tax=Dichanthelium oligosanthes TaxID=888268 RepID=A0A1E5WL61_9POAL|nr:Nuclear transcription factor Y subunit C-2 [Dichanthelium oligosanthes]
MKADEDVKMIAAEAPVVFAKACEMFILELTLRSWLHTEGTNRRTLQRSDVAAAITANEMFDFLMDVAPVEERRGDGVLPPPPTTPLSYGPGPAMSASFPTYANQQPMQFMWPPPEFQQQQQQNPDEGQDE